jgi:ornithine cyclodeaminase
VVSGDVVRTLIDVDQAMATIEKTYADYGRERQVLSAPPALLLPTRTAGHAAFKVKGARIASLGIAGFRMIADRDTDAGEETIDYCWIAEAATGRLLGLVDETSLHRLRTALTGVVAAKWLARRDSRVATIIGAGKIADEIPLGLSRTFDLQELRVVSTRMQTAQAFAERHAGVAPMRPFANVQEATRGADIIIAITSAPRPVLTASDLAPGVFICGMGGAAEIAADVLDRADRFVIDDLEYAWTIGSVRGWLESGLSRERIAQRVDADIGEIVTGTKKVAGGKKDIVLSIIQGMACCDVALAHLVLQRSGAI